MGFGFIDDLKYFFVTQKYTWKSFLAYRSQAALWLLDSIFSILGTVIPVTAIYYVSAGINGWSFYQMLLLAGASSIVIGFVYYFISGWNIVNAMQQGKVDVYLFRPYGRFTILLADFADVSTLGQILVGLLVFGVAAAALHLQFYNMLPFLVLFTFGTIAIVSFLLMVTMLSYHFLRSGMFFSRMVSLFSSVGNYPLSVFGIFGRILFTVLLPIGFAYYYPVQVLLGRVSGLSLVELALGSIVVTAVSYYSFYYLLKKYTSGGG
jgi:ABC-2 type transport system permease protein